MDNPDKVGGVKMTNQTLEPETTKSEAAGERTGKLITCSDTLTMGAVLEDLTDSRANFSPATRDITKA